MYTCVVVGCGGVGSFALRALKQKGESNVLGLERFWFGHTSGSSHGLARIYRKAYFEHRNYVPWIQYSENVFKELDSDLLEQCGTLVIEEPNGPVIAGCLQSAEEHGIEVEFLGNKELRKRFPQFKLHSDETVGLLEPGGGFVRCEKAMTAALKDSQAEVWEKTVVKDVQDKGSHVEIILSKDGADDIQIESKKVVVSAGAWAPSILDKWQPFLTPTRQLQGWIDATQLQEPSLYQPSRQPTWYMSTPAYSLPIYGIPTDPTDSNGRAHWLKVASHKRPDIVDPGRVSADFSAAETEELLKCLTLAYADETAKMEFVATKPCLYTMTPDEHFIIGKVSANVVAAAGLSGHGFKMTPALGAMLVDLALDDEEAVANWKMDFCAPSRFGVTEPL